MYQIFGQIFGEVKHIAVDPWNFDVMSPCPLPIPV